MQAIVKIIGRDCTKPHVWGGGLPGPPLFHIQFVFYSYILCTASTSIPSMGSLCLFSPELPSWRGSSAHPSRSVAKAKQAGNAQWRTWPVFAPKLSLSSSFSPLGPRRSEAFPWGLGFERDPGPFFTWFPAFLLPADRAVQDVLIFKPVKVTIEMDLSGLQLCLSDFWEPRYTAQRLTRLVWVLYPMWGARLLHLLNGTFALDLSLPCGAVAEGRSESLLAFCSPEVWKFTHLAGCWSLLRPCCCTTTKSQY